MRRMIFGFGLTLLAAFACTDETASLGDAQSGLDVIAHADAAPHDAAPPADAEPADSTVNRDASPADAPNRDAENADAENADAENADAELADAADGGFDCVTLGTTCSPNIACTTPEMCSSPGDVCIPPSPPMCGGFANTPCPAGLVCLSYQHTDFGACVTRAERACICAQVAGQAAFGC